MDSEVNRFGQAGTGCRGKGSCRKSTRKSNRGCRCTVETFLVNFCSGSVKHTCCVCSGIIKGTGYRKYRNAVSRSSVRMGRNISVRIRLQRPCSVRMQKERNKRKPCCGRSDKLRNTRKQEQSSAG